MVYHCGFDVSLVANDIEYLFLCLAVICVSLCYQREDPVGLLSRFLASQRIGQDTLCMTFPIIPSVIIVSMRCNPYGWVDSEFVHTEDYFQTLGGISATAPEVISPVTDLWATASTLATVWELERRYLGRTRTLKIDGEFFLSPWLIGSHVLRCASILPFPTSFYVFTSKPIYSTPFDYLFFCQSH